MEIAQPFFKKQKVWGCVRIRSPDSHVQYKKLEGPMQAAKQSGTDSLRFSIFLNLFGILFVCAVGQLGRRHRDAWRWTKNVGHDAVTQHAIPQRENRWCGCSLQAIQSGYWIVVVSVVPFHKSLTLGLWVYGRKNPCLLLSILVHFQGSHLISLN